MSIYDYLNALTFTVPSSLGNTTLDFYYQITDGVNYVDVSNSIDFKEKVINYSTIESQGNITLVKDGDTYTYAQDAQGNKTAITYLGEHITNNMWDGWFISAAENINGVNSAIWEFSHPVNGSSIPSMVLPSRRWFLLRTEQKSIFG